MTALTGAPPTHVVVTHAGGGNTTGTARGLKRAGAIGTQIVSASVDLSGLHMASDTDFNRKSFTTGHTGFGVPFATWPDRADVPRNAARSLRYMDRYLTVTQGEVFYVTEAMSKLEGLERGPSGNTAMAAAFSLARELPRDATVVVQETEYTGAGKHHWAQLNFARQMGVEVRAGDPRENKPGVVIVIPETPEQIQAKDFDLVRMRTSYVRNALTHAPKDYAADRQRHRVPRRGHQQRLGVRRGGHRRAQGGLAHGSARHLQRRPQAPRPSDRRTARGALLGALGHESWTRSSSWLGRTRRRRSSAPCSCAWASTRSRATRS